jgi:hypothetical protein
VSVNIKGSEFEGNVNIDPKSNVYSSKLKGNIKIGPYVILDNVTIVGNFNITCENRMTNIIHSVINGHGELKDCSIHDCFLAINGDSENFILNGLIVHESRTFNNVLMDVDEGINEPLEKETSVLNNIIIVE